MLRSADPSVGRRNREETENMKRATMILAGLGAVTVLTSGAFVGTALSDDDGKRVMRHEGRAEAHHAQFRPHRAAHFGRHGGRMGEQMLELYDTNKDGKLTQDEIDKTRADRLAQFDADKDGTLNLQEYQALWLDAYRERMVDMFQGHDDDGDGKVTVAEFQKRYKDLVARLDRNDDGVFSKEDTRRRFGRDDDDDDRRGHGRHGRDL
jgi:Ca2+-binding EF-hand superfamily protein